MTEDAEHPREQGQRLMRDGEIRLAEEKFREAVARDPQDGASYGFLGVCKMRRGELHTAVACIQQAARLQPSDVNARFNLAQALFSVRRFNEALVEVDEALAIQPGHQKARELRDQLNDALRGNPFEVGPFAAKAADPLGSLLPKSAAAASPSQLAMRAATPGKLPSPALESLKAKIEPIFLVLMHRIASLVQNIGRFVTERLQSSRAGK